MTSLIIGAGGGGKSGGGAARVAQEAPDSLRSKAYARVVDLISEGEIEGLVAGLQSVYLDDTPIQNADGTNNFTGITLESRNGTQQQSYVPGFSSVENEISVGVEVKATQSVVRSITDADVDAVRVKVSVPQLTNQNTTNGDLNGSEVSFAIDRQTNGGGFVEVIKDTIAYVLRWIESIGFVDNLSQANQKNIAETFSATEFLAQFLTKGFTSAVSWGEHLARQSTVRSSEVLPVSGLHTRQPTKVISEAFGSSEVLSRQVSKAVIEAIGFAETYADLIAYILRVTENIGLADSSAKQTLKPLTEAFIASDLASLELIKRVAEAVAMADAFGRTVAYRKTLSEGMAVNDAIKRSLQLSTHEALKLTEQYRRHANGVISDMIISSSEITEEDFQNIVDNGHPPGYTNFRDFIQGDYTYQRALFRAILKSSNADRGYIDALRLTVDVPDIFDRGVAEVTNAAAGVSVQFSRTFRFTPQVTITHKGGTTTAIPRLLGTPSTTGFTAVLEDKTGARVTGSFSWLAQGC